MNIGCRGSIVVLSFIASLMPMQGNTQPPVRIIVYADESLFEKLESARIDEWRTAMQERCGCRLESIQPAPGQAWVFEVPERPEDAQLEALLDCLRKQEGVRDAERDQMLQPMTRNQ